MRTMRRALGAALYAPRFMRVLIHGLNELDGKCLRQKAGAVKRKEVSMKAVISVTGKDGVGIVADVSRVCTEFNANISDVSQTVMDKYFVMIMLVEMDAMDKTFVEFSDAMKALGERRGLVINTMHEDIFNAMHTI